jgi:glucose-6-phosphate isomerase
MRARHLREIVAGDPDRWRHCHVEHDGWLLDFSRQRATAETIGLLQGLARAVELPAKITALFRGDPVNSTERRSVLHMALRSAFAGPPDVQAEVQASRAQLREGATAIRSGAQRGPLLVCDALRHEWSGGITPHFVSNVDRTQLDDLKETLDPAETLVIVCSKTFTTQETQANAQAARAWIVAALGPKSPADHFVAVSTNTTAMDAFGIAPNRRFTMWDWVGGRYSVWSAVGLIAELTVGSERFEEFLGGASDIDRHFLDAPFERNLPVLIGLLAAWNRTFLGLPTLCVLPYDQRLAQLPAYLQQLEMESNGKSVTLAGDRVNFATAPVVWGAAGSNAQHSFFQMLHQGTPTAALDFIAPLRSSWDDAEAQALALRNCFAQTQALAYGHTLGEAEDEMRAAGLDAAEVARLAPHRVYEGNRPSSLLLLPQTTARTLGGLLALYEHSVFVQGTLWGINSFDQFGVEFGKKLASGISLSGNPAPTGEGAAGLAALIDYVAKNR